MSAELRISQEVRWSGHLIAAIAVCAIAGVVVLIEGVPIVIAAVRPSADMDKVDTTTPLLKGHLEAQGTILKRLEGRSMFSKPKPWPRIQPPPPPIKEVVEKPVVVKPPEPPAEYSGPKVAGMLGNTVYFDSISAVEVGKEGGGVTVVAVVSAWELKLKHMGKEYTVPFGQKPNEEVFLPPSQRTTLPSGIVPATRPAADPAPSGASPSPAAPPTPVTAPATGGSSEAPPPLTKDAIQAMSVETATAMQGTLTRAMESKDLDAATKARLKQEIEWIGERLRQR